MSVKELRIKGQRYFVLRGNVLEYDDVYLLQAADTGKMRIAYANAEGFEFADPDPEDSISHAPWSPEEVESLNGFQRCGFMHEFTGGKGETLIATSTGWVESQGGPVVQTWAHKFMVDGGWRKHPLFKEG